MEAARSDWLLLIIGGMFQPHGSGAVGDRRDFDHHGDSQDFLYLAGRRGRDGVLPGF